MVNDGKERTHMMLVKFGALLWPMLGKAKENLDTLGETQMHQASSLGRNT